MCKRETERERLQLFKKTEKERERERNIERNRKEREREGLCAYLGL